MESKLKAKNRVRHPFSSHGVHLAALGAVLPLGGIWGIYRRVWWLQ